MAVRRIDEILVEHVKGIDSRAFKQLQMYPNKPTILVAPNGSGKSSIAAAFGGLKKSRLELHKTHLRNGDETLIPLLRITYTDDAGNIVVRDATSTTNTISADFDVVVINSQLVSKAHVLKFGGKSIPQSAIEVEPIVLVASVPTVAKVPYTAGAARAAFGPNGKLLPNLSDVLTDSAFLTEIERSVDFSKASQVGAQKPLTDLKNWINAATGTAPDIANGVPAALVAAALDVPHIKQTVAALKLRAAALASDIEYCLAAMQIGTLRSNSKPEFKAATQYAQYQEELKAYKALFASVSGTWKNIRPQQVKGQLVVEFPKANQISNGERDVISFLGQILTARVHLRKERCLLVIDEIFDYLDDANLIACQYYLSTMMSDFKAAGRQLFPLIFTHLDPIYFRNFVFKKQNVQYLNRTTVASKAVEKIILKRDDPSIEQPVSQAFLHFHPVHVTLVAEFNLLGLDPTLSDSTLFEAHVLGQLHRYKAKLTYDPIAVCCAVRREIERVTYAQLSPADQPEFLTTHTTVAKLEYAETKGIDVPELHYLLGMIYNEVPHIKGNYDHFSPLASKLENLTVRQMITTGV